MTSGVDFVLFINGKFPIYSQTFVHDQVSAIRKHFDGQVSVYAKQKTRYRFANSDPACASGLIHAKPITLKTLGRVLRCAYRNPLHVIKAFRLFYQCKISKATFMLAIQLRRLPSVCITHFGNNCEIGVELKKFFCPQVKNIVVFHGHDVSSYIQKNGWKLYQQAAPHIDSAICVNQIWAQKIRENTSIRDVRTIYLGTRVMPLRTKPAKLNREFNILFVGRFVEKKGFEILYTAVKMLMERRSSRTSVRVHCVGDGKLLSYFKELARSDNMSDIFIFHGARQKPFVLDLMQKCDLLVAPSRTADDGDSEGVPVALMEAMMSGLPVISTYHSGIPELIVHEDTGVLVPENNAQELCSAIERAILNPADMTVLATRAYQHVVEFHDEERQVEKFITAVKEL